MISVSRKTIHISRKASWIRDIHLLAQIRDHAGGNSDRGFQKRAQKSDGTELYGKSESVVITTPLVQKCSISVIKVKIAI
jgi:hypothetical protein